MAGRTAEEAGDETAETQHQHEPAQQQEQQLACFATNCLWPQYAVLDSQPLVEPKHCVTPELTADAAMAIIQQPHTSFSGMCCLDARVIMQLGGDLQAYQVDPTLDVTELATNEFVSRQSHHGSSQPHLYPRSTLDGDPSLPGFTDERFLRLPDMRASCASCYDD